MATAADPPRRPGRWRRLGRAVVFAALLVLVAGEAAYLLRRPLFERLICTQVGRLLGTALGGEVRIERLGGSWITGLHVRGITIDTGGVLRSVRDGELQVQLDPLALLHGDLAGLRRLRLRASALHLDLEAGGGGEPSPPEPAGGEFDLGPLLRLLPAGAEIDLGELAVAGHGTSIDGPARVVLAPVRPDADLEDGRELRVDGPGLALAANARADGRVLVAAELADVTRVPKLFTALDPLQGGTATVTGEVHLAPFAAQASLAVRDLRVRGRAVERLVAAGRVDDLGLAGLAVEIEAPGLHVRTDGVALTFASALASLRGDLALDVRDLGPYRELLPPPILQQLPITGSLRARAGDGRLAVGDGFFAAASVDVRLAAGAVTFAGATGVAADAPVRALVTLRAPDRLPLPADLPVRPRTGTVDLRVGAQDGIVQLHGDLDLQIADADGRPGRLGGGIDLQLGDELAVRPNVRIEGELLRAAARVDLDGALRLAATALHVDAFHLRLDGGNATVDARGRVPLDAADAAALLRGADVDVAWTALPLAPIGELLPPATAAAAGIGQLAGTASGRVAAHGDRAEAELQVEARGLPGLDPAADGAVQLALRLLPDALQLVALSVRSPAGTVSANGTVPDLGLQRLLARGLDGVDWRALAPTAEVDLNLPLLERLALGALAGIDLHGGVQGKLRIDGLQPEAASMSLTARALRLAVDGADVVRDVDAELRLGAGTLRIERLRAEAAGAALQLAGELTATAGGGVAIKALQIQDGLGGRVDLQGELGSLTDGDWRAALRAGDLRAEIAAVALWPWLGRAGVDAPDARATGSLRWTAGAAVPLHLQLAAEAPQVRTGDRDLSLQVDVTIDGDADGIRLTALTASSGALQVTGSGAVAIAPLALLDDPAALATAGVDLALDVPTTDLSQLPQEALGLAMLQGRFGLTLRLQGTLQQPQPSATVDFGGGTLLTADGQRLDDIAAHLVVATDVVHIEQLSASRGRGPLSVTGEFHAPGPLWRDWARGEVQLAVHGDNVLLHRKEGVKVRADLDVAVAGPLRELRVTGDVRLRDSKMLARIPLLELNRTGGRSTTTGIVLPGLGSGDANMPVGGQFDVRVVTSEPFEIKNNVVDGRFEVALALRGTLQQPLLEGTISGPEAALILPGIRLRASTLLVEFPRGNSPFPTVTVTARGRRHGYDVQVVVRGRYDRPQVLLSSNPPLPPEDLVVLITTGARPEALRGTAGVSTVLGSYLAQELADWIFGSESTEAKESFLDRFTIETGTEMSQGGTESVVVEFRVLDHLFLQGERDVFEDLNMGVVYRLRF